MTLDNFYDEAYFDGGKGYHKYEFSGQYEKWAENIIRSFNPKRVLDVGCAKGFLVKALRDRGVQAWGVDTSEYAIAHAPEEVADYLFRHDITELRDIVLPRVDLIVSTDTFEHIPEEKLDVAKMFLLNHAPKHFIRITTVNSPDWEHDASHVTIHPIEWWQEWFEDAHWEESI